MSLRYVKYARDLDYISVTSYFIDVKTNEIYRYGTKNITYKLGSRTYLYCIDKNKKVFRVSQNPTKTKYRQVNAEYIRVNYPEYFL